MGNLGYQEVLILMIAFLFIVLIILIFWKFPSFMKKMGRGVREFKDAKNNVQSKAEATRDENEIK
jgi:sec-independent protein translocase protein TatA